jgi:hypothetical protein
MTKNPINPEPTNWDDAGRVGEYIAGMLAAYPQEFYDDRPPYASPLSSEPRFDIDLALAARAEGLTEAEIGALLRQCHSENPADALDAYRDMNSGVWKVCPSAIPPWGERPAQWEPRQSLTEWVEAHRQGKPYR